MSQYSTKPAAAIEVEEDVKQQAGEGEEEGLRDANDEQAVEREREAAQGEGGQGDGEQGEGGQGEGGQGAQERRTTAPALSRYPKAGEAIQFKDGEVWQNAQVISRGGKASSKVNKDYFNVRVDGEASGIYLDKVEWRKAIIH